MGATNAWEGYFADPFALRTGDGYVAYGTNPECSLDREFEILTSPDLTHWKSAGGALTRPSKTIGTDFWAPEIAHSDDRWWMYYSVGHGIVGHHLRIAVADSPTGPFEDLGINLTPHERFAIDAHPFQDQDGRWYLFFARDVLDADRPGTHLAVAPLTGMTAFAADPIEVLRPNADWQIYERNRLIYGDRYTWHTLEGPSVIYREGRYWLTYSGGAWTGEHYAVSWAVSDSPLGPWRPAPSSASPLLRTGNHLIGPGHNSLTVAPDGSDAIVFHSWNPSRTRRELQVRRIVFGPDAPSVKTPTCGVPAPSQHTCLDQTRIR
ncbi:glycoside hydrolase [Cryobacterium sp. TMT2-17-1]|uniref:glycoside hydrolase family 43 protein n=1 Tax=Cryobacterium sp. TMT2-17-1 TaxID=1259248 RepID=UPI00106A2B99|nr:glycoside hydrolase family 43 protein [Cryobacterium sp. TMT2-17-1]TFC49773.1 glycoside hydrolase [Cryobacterium sp. TMT2-17-1]